MGGSYRRKENFRICEIQISEHEFWKVRPIYDKVRPIYDMFPLRNKSELVLSEENENLSPFCFRNETG